MIRSILAVLLGIVALTISSFAIEAVTNPILFRLFPDALPNSQAISRNTPAAIFLFSYSLMCVAFGGYVTAWVARRLEVRHALIMGVIQAVLTIFAMQAFRDQAPMKVWIISMLMTTPAAWLGGLIRANQIRRHVSPA